MLAAMADLSEKEGLFQVGPVLSALQSKDLSLPSGLFFLARPSTPPATMGCSSSGSGATDSGSR